MRIVCKIAFILHILYVCGFPRATFISDQMTMNSGIPKLILRFDNLLEGLENSLKVIVLMVITEKKDTEM